MTSRSILLVGLTVGVLGGVEPARAQTVREKVAVEVITIRLTARDASGKRVEDLTPSDLILTVDGKPVAIETFVRPSAPGAAVGGGGGRARGFVPTVRRPLRSRGSYER